jgi:RNA polymerase sigma factor (TIGR02999 family)
MRADEPELASLFAAAAQGDAEANDRALAAVYGELRRLASAQLGRERPSHTLQPTALIHEAYLRLLRESEPWRNRPQFLALAARAMRQILIEHARRRLSARRNGAAAIPLASEPAAASEPRASYVLHVDAALEKLAAIDAIAARVVELRFFGGFSVDESASLLDIHRAPSSVTGTWPRPGFTARSNDERGLTRSLATSLPAVRVGARARARRSAHRAGAGVPRR